MKDSAFHGSPTASHLREFSLPRGLHSFPLSDTSRSFDTLMDGLIFMNLSKPTEVAVTRNQWMLSESCGEHRYAEEILFDIIRRQTVYVYGHCRPVFVFHV